MSCEREKRKAGTSSSSHATRRSVPARPPHQESRRLQPSPRALQVGLQGQALRAQLLQGQLPSQVVGRSHKVLSRGGRGRATRSEARCTLALPLASACPFFPPPDCHSPLPPPPLYPPPASFLPRMWLGPKEFAALAPRLAPLRHLGLPRILHSPPRRSRRGPPGSKFQIWAVTRPPGRGREAARILYRMGTSGRTGGRPNDAGRSTGARPAGREEEDHVRDGGSRQGQEGLRIAIASGPRSRRGHISDPSASTRPLLHPLLSPPFHKPRLFNSITFPLSLIWCFRSSLFLLHFLFLTSG